MPRYYTLEEARKLLSKLRQDPHLVEEQPMTAERLEHIASMVLQESEDRASQGMQEHSGKVFKLNS